MYVRLVGCRPYKCRPKGDACRGATLLLHLQGSLTGDSWLTGFPCVVGLISPFMYTSLVPLLPSIPFLPASPGMYNGGR